MVSVHLIFRKKLPQYNSIEELFGWLIPQFRGEVEIDRIELPYSGAGIRSIIGNIRYIRKKNFKNNIVHITGHENYIAPFCGRNCILTIHDIGSAFTGNAAKRLIIKIVWFWIPALFVKKITVISEFSAQEVKKLIPYAQHKIKVIHNPVSPELVYNSGNFNTEKPVILFLGTKPNKNLERTIDALAGLSCSLVIIGQLSPLQLEKLNKSGIEFINESFIPYKKIIEHYRNCHLVLFPSLYEGFGLPVIEAQAIGRPIITSNVASIPEVAGRGALLVNPEKINEIRYAVSKVTNNKILRDQLTKDGITNVQKFKSSYIAKKYIHVYNELYTKYSAPD